MWPIRPGTRAGSLAGGVEASLKCLPKSIPRNSGPSAGYLVEHPGVRPYNKTIPNSILRESNVTQSSETTVTIYTHPDCAYSSAAKMDYRHRGVSFVEIDVSKEKDKIDDLLSLTGGERVTPVIVENGQATIGFKGGN